MKILSEGGIRGLWAGWVPNVQRAALVNMGGKFHNLGLQRLRSHLSFKKGEVSYSPGLHLLVIYTGHLFEVHCR